MNLINLRANGCLSGQVLVYLDSDLGHGIQELRENYARIPIAMRILPRPHGIPRQGCPAQCDRNKPAMRDQIVQKNGASSDQASFPQRWLHLFLVCWKMAETMKGV